MHDFEYLKRESGINLICLDETESTNTYAKDKAVPLGSLVIAKKQSRGRGRLGHEFFSPEGGIYFSYVPKKMSFEDVQLLTQKAGVCICRALEAVIFAGHFIQDDPFFRIKWVNDIFAGDKKLCGILCEKTSDRLVVGVGINLRTDSFPAELKEIAAGLLDPYVTERIEVLRRAEPDLKKLSEQIIAETVFQLNCFISEDEIKAEYLKRRSTPFRADVQSGYRHSFTGRYG